MLLGNDANRYEYIKSNLGRIADIQNKYVLLDAFKLFSTSFMMYDFLNAAPVVPPPPPPGPLPVINFPSCNNYNGPSGCNLPMPDNDFELLTQNFKNMPNEGVVEQAATEFASMHCISTAQMMKLSLMLQMESSRLAFCKNSIQKVNKNQESMVKINQIQKPLN